MTEHEQNMQNLYKCYMEEMAKSEHIGNVLASGPLFVITDDFTPVKQYDTVGNIDDFKELVACQLRENGWTW